MLTSSFIVLASLVALALTCSRVTYNCAAGPAKPHFVVGRALDFPSFTNTTIWAFPPGARRFGGVQDNPFTWTSKLGSVSAVVHGKIYAEGVNTEGLAGSAMYMLDSRFEERNGTRESIFSGVWMQYFLDMYRSVDDVASDYCPDEGGQEPFQVVPELILEDFRANLRLSLSDAKGGNLIIEFVEGKLRCQRSKHHAVSIDGPLYEDQVPIHKSSGPEAQEPLSRISRSSRYLACLSHYNRHIPPVADPDAAIAYVVGMLRARAVVSGKKYTSKSQAWPTQWRMYTDLQDKRVLYASETSAMSFWYDVNEFNMARGAEPKVLTMEDLPWGERMGDVTNKFKTVIGNSCVWTDCER